MDSFEKLGVFYLGRPYDLAAGKPKEGYLLYDSKDLTTHAVCVGMTGSGKTGLCIDLLEEAAMDGIPAIVVDPKGDMANLLLSFPDLKPEDFRPWINEDDAAQKGLSPDEFAAKQAETWQKGLASWGQSGERIRQMRNNAEFAIYTPGSTAGTPVSILRSFAKPSPAILDDDELLREQVSGTAASLLGLIGLDADPIKSRDHILLSTIILTTWQQGQDLDLASLISLIQQPPVNQIGVMPLDSFYPAKDRFALALQFNNLLASPGFASWLNGVPLDIDQILYTPESKPKISIFSIAHLGEAERLFFVSLLLNQVLAWTRSQTGTSSLRAILYMDEIYGYFPPVANPPTKLPLLTLLKQARAYGLGIMLTTQNPVDLDYKGLANAGTWFIGRLQTERDKMRVLEGLEGASATQGVAFDRGKMEQILAGLGNRVFLMHNVHDDQPTLFETRWSMSYLRGPLTRKQIQQLAPAKTAAAAATYIHVSATAPAPAAPTPAPAGVTPTPVFPAPATMSAAPTTLQTAAPTTQQPALPQAIRQYFMPIRSRGDNLRYQPMALGSAEIGFRNAKANVQQITESTFISAINDSVFPVDWDKSIVIDMPVTDLEITATSNIPFATLPAAAADAKSYPAWERDLKTWLYQTQQLTILQCPALKMNAALGESEREFRIRLSQMTREFRDAEVAKLRQKYAAKIQALEEKIRKSEQAVEREQEQAKQQQMQTAISVGATILSSFLGKKRVSATSLGRATTAVRGASRAFKEAGDVDRSKETVEVYKADLEELENAFKAESDTLAASLDAMNQEIVPLNIRPTKQDIMVKALVLVWMPYLIKSDGSSEPAWV
jgi:hypothetical protein